MNDKTILGIKSDIWFDLAEWGAEPTKRQNGKKTTKLNPFQIKFASDMGKKAEDNQIALTERQIIHARSILLKAKRRGYRRL